jgi:hypothetical protein
MQPTEDAIRRHALHNVRRPGTISAARSLDGRVHQHRQHEPTRQHLYSDPSPVKIDATWVSFLFFFVQNVQRGWLITSTRTVCEGKCDILNRLEICSLINGVLKLTNISSQNLVGELPLLIFKVLLKGKKNPSLAFHKSFKKIYV